MEIINITFGLVSVTMLLVGLAEELKFVKLPKDKFLKALWALIVFMVLLFIFGFGYFTVALIFKYFNIGMLGNVNQIVALTFLGGGIWMPSMIILEYKIIQDTEKKKGEEKMLIEVEKEKERLEKAMASRMEEVAIQLEKMKKNRDILVQKEAEIARVKAEIERLEKLAA